MKNWNEGVSFLQRGGLLTKWKKRCSTQQTKSGSANRGRDSLIPTLSSSVLGKACLLKYSSLRRKELRILYIPFFLSFFFSERNQYQHFNDKPWRERKREGWTQRRTSQAASTPPSFHLCLPSPPQTRVDHTQQAHHLKMNCTDLQKEQTNRHVFRTFKK